MCPHKNRHKTRRLLLFTVTRFIIAAQYEPIGTEGIVAYFGRTLQPNSPLGATKLAQGLLVRISKAGRITLAYMSWFSDSDRVRAPPRSTPRVSLGGQRCGHRQVLRAVATVGQFSGCGTAMGDH
jgi:hypothetical protein